MTIDEYRSEVMRLVLRFGEDHYTKEYLNKCWHLWKEIPKERLAIFVDNNLTKSDKRCLAIEGGLINKERHIKGAQEYMDSNYTSSEYLTKAMQENKASNLWELVLKSK